ncbi:TetR/AcrR family transcriptional regulator [uncultured Paraglaciecola sp.]|uniref:TetR/AcrR family transcriptional regulator n=1 Tax=uncultured Paraglaciecola sp. TaxID=1765024 RepID=UPI0030DA2C01|tara:strand:+ start:5609 stop:6262 length:654 start_codon:yes stop_codon:yes gene_type:complete
MSSNTKTTPIDTPQYAPRERGLIRRDKIIQAATKVFVGSGYEATSLQEIVALAGGSLATLYRLFGNKEGLFYAVIERKSDQLLSEIDYNDLQSKSPRVALIEIGMRFFSMVISPEVGAIHRLIIGEAVRTPRLREIFLTLATERAIRNLAEYLQAQVDKQHLDIKNCFIAASHFMGALKGNYHIRCMLGEVVNLSLEEQEEFVTAAVDMFLNGYARP